MSFDIINTSNASITASIENPTLQAYTEDLMAYAYDLKINALRIASTLVCIVESDCLQEFDNSIVTFGEKVLGLKKSQTYAWLKVGREFLTDHGTSVLAKPEDTEYTMTQLQALLPLTVELAKQAAEDRLIDPSMTVKQLKEYVETHRPDAEKVAERKAKAEEKKLAKAEEEAEKEESDARHENVGKTSVFVCHKLVIGTDDNGDTVIGYDGVDVSHIAGDQFKTILEMFIGTWSSIN